MVNREHRVLYKSSIIEIPYYLRSCDMSFCVILAPQVNETATSSEETDLLAHDTDDDQMKAARMKMYGQMTQTTQEWHPDRLLCRRFNVPNPYPE